ncbi:MAG: PIG-L family deacetylase [Bacteroidaceae bacterium]|nr:PIG-L family deacetylase [Bacteroidaceae bacterium]
MVIKSILRKLRISYIRGRIIYAPEIKVHGHALVIAPHPDDEVFGCAGLISRLVRVGHEIDVIIMSGGGASHNTCCPEGVSDLIEKRRQLTLNAMKVLGLSHEKIYFLDYPDGEIDYANEETEQLKRLMTEISPDVVFIPHIKGEGWRDHKNTSMITLSCLPEKCKVFEYCVWFWYYGCMDIDWENACVLKMTDGEYKNKQSAIREYMLPKAPCGNPLSGVLPKVFLWAMNWNKELFFKVR